MDGRGKRREYDAAGKRLLQPVTDALASNLGNMRLLRRLSQRELARRAGVCHSLVCKIENQRIPTTYTRTVEALARALWCRPHHLTDGQLRVPVEPSTWDVMSFRPDGRRDNQAPR